MDNVVDTYEHLKRGPQILTQKDIGLILAYTGVAPGWKVIEGGSGSGGLTLFLANSVGPEGRVYSYDWRDEHQRIAKHNVDRAGFNDRVVFHQGDVANGFSERDVDLVTLDVPEPWKAYKAARGALKPGGFLVTFIPTYEQLKKCVRVLQKNKFSAVVRECMVREYKTEETSTRPENVGLIFTGFLIFSRKI